MLIKVVLLIAVLLLFRWCSFVPLLCGIPIVSPVFHSSASVLIFHQRSGVPLVFCCSAHVLCSTVPCSGAPSFIVCPFLITRTTLGRPGVILEIEGSIQQIYKRGTSFAVQINEGKPLI